MTLDRVGVRCLLLEADDDVGGRVRTDRHADGFLLDRGFQVYLDSYPDARRLLDHEALDLRPFLPGALTFLRNRTDPVGVFDPVRSPAQLWRTTMSPALPVADKLRVARLQARVLAKSQEQLLAETPGSAADVLAREGLSEFAIESFFRPFFGGVFLDRDLATSGGLFLWLFRLFATGRACVPAGGMGEIPRQLASRLVRSEIRRNTPVAEVSPRRVRLLNGTAIVAAAVVVAVDAPQAARLLGDDAPTDLATQLRQVKATTTHYFTHARPPTDENALLLSGQLHDDAAGINTVACLSKAAPTYAPDGRDLLSVNVVGVQDADPEPVRRGMAVLFGDAYAAGLQHLRSDVIDFALPDQRPPGLTPVHKSPRLADGLFLCGDHRDTASINGAIRSGVAAAEAVQQAEPVGSLTSC